MRFLQIGCLIGTFLTGCAMQPKPKYVPLESAMTTVEAEKLLESFIDRHVAEMSRLEKENNLAYWRATTNGDEAAYQMTASLEYKIRALHADPEDYAFLKQAQKSGKITDQRLRRQLEILSLSYQENQVDKPLLEKMTALSAEIQKIFNGYRAVVEGRQLADSDIYDILRSSVDSGVRKAAWEGFQARGKLIKHKLLELVKLRNSLARKLGYTDFYTMRLTLLEQDPAQIERIFDGLAAGTDRPYAGLKQKIDQHFADRYGIAVKDLRPWHYEDPFFQEAPVIGNLDLDRYFKDVDPKTLAAEFFQGMGFEVQDILDRSDLYEKPGKMPHAYCTDIDREGDVRILANLENTEKWVSTLLHELGHAVYDKYNDRTLAWLLRAPAHSFATEAAANFFGRLTRQTHFLQAMLGLDPRETQKLDGRLAFELKLSMLVFARWSLVMRHFEKELYRDPDQNLNKLWWDLKKRYQRITPPDDWDHPNWAAKIHIANWPVYYHNYLLGELMASQLLAHIAKTFYQGKPIADMQLVGRKDVGVFLKEKIFAPGRSLRWDRLLVQATGETLNPEHFIRQFAK